MNNQKIFTNLSIANLQRLPTLLIYAKVVRDSITIKDIPFAYANPDFLKELKISIPIVRVYLRKPSKNVFEEFTYFYILKTDQHFLKINMNDTDARIIECLGIPYQWFMDNGVRSNYAEAYVKEAPELTLKPL